MLAQPVLIRDTSKNPTAPNAFAALRIIFWPHPESMRPGFFAVGRQTFLGLDIDLWQRYMYIFSGQYFVACLMQSASIFLLHNSVCANLGPF